ncbi:unnamed protein product, partial [Rotaria socialis]
MGQPKVIFGGKNIGLERRNDNILSSYSFANSDHQYAVEDDPSSYCQS